MTKLGYIYSKEMLEKKRKGNKYICLVCNFEWKAVKENYYPSCCPICLAHNWDYGNNINCFICNKNVLIPRIHHINNNHKDNRKNNRIPLCERCHKKIHHNQLNITQKVELNKKLENSREDKAINKREDEDGNSY